MSPFTAGRLTQMGMNSLQQISLEPGQEVVELMIPANKVGLIIGRWLIHCKDDILSGDVLNVRFGGFR